MLGYNAEGPLAWDHGGQLYKCVGDIWTAGNPPGLGPVAANCACVQVLGGQLDQNGLHHLLDAALDALAARTVRALGRSRGGGDGYGTRAVSLLIPEGTCKKTTLFCKGVPLGVLSGADAVQLASAIRHMTHPTYELG